MCNHENCEEPTRARGLCEYHYNRDRRDGRKWCKKLGCEEPPRTLGMCKKHYGDDYRSTQRLEKMSREFAIQRKRMECRRCKTNTHHLELIPKKWGTGKVTHLCYSCETRRVNRIKILAEPFGTYEDWFGFFNYSEKGDLLRWNRSTSRNGRGR